MLSGWETRREKARQSQKWIDRQERKIDGALRAFDGYVGAAEEDGREYVVGGQLTIADIGIICTVGFIDYADLRVGWRERYPSLGRYFDRLNELDAFQETKPVMFELTEQVV